MRPEFVDPLTYLELRSSQNLAILLGDQQAGHNQRFLFGLLGNDFSQALGFGFLFGSQNRFRHGCLCVENWGEFPPPLGSCLQSTKNPPTFQLLTLARASP